MGRLMDRRLELHEMLCNTLGSRHVYFQPPSNVQMVYPAIRYSRNRIENTSADNQTYIQNTSYKITVIDYDPDGEIAEKVSQIPGIVYDRSYVADNLNHDSFILFY